MNGFLQVALVLSIVVVASASWSPRCPSDNSKEVYVPDILCSRYWQCSNGQAIRLSCPAGLVFNPKLSVCDWPQNVSCYQPPVVPTRRPRRTTTTRRPKPTRRPWPGPHPFVDPTNFSSEE